MKFTSLSPIAIIINTPVTAPVNTTPAPVVNSSNKKHHSSSSSDETETVAVAPAAETAAKAAWELPDGSFKEDKKFLYVSTDEVYGAMDDGDNYFYETTPFSPHSPYSASKASGDMLTERTSVTGFMTSFWILCRRCCRTKSK